MLGWPFAARDEYLRILNRRARSADGVRSIVLCGDPGVGKTRLTRAVSEDLARRGWTVSWFSVSASVQAQPLGAMSAMAGHFDGDPVMSFQRAAQDIGAHGPRALFVIDDAHLLDNTSVLLARRVVEEAKVATILVVRTGQDSLPETLARLVHDGHVERVDLSPLDEEETSAMVEFALGGPVEPSALRRLWSQSRGNALYLRLLVEACTGARSLRLVSGVWRWDGPISLTPTLHEALEEKVRGCLEGDARARSVAELVALAEPVELSVLRSFVGPVGEDAEPGATDPLEKLEEAGLIVVENESRAGSTESVCRMTHPLVSEHLRTGVGQLRRRRLHGRLAELLSARSDVDPLRLGNHLLESGNLSGGPALRRAAEEATRRLDLPLAITFARAAFAEDRTPESAFLLAYALSWSTAADEAEGVLTEMEAVVRTPLDHAYRVQIRAANTYFILREPVKALLLLDDAYAQLHADLDATAEVAAMRSWLRAFSGDAHGALEDSRTADGSSHLSPLGLATRACGELAASSMIGLPGSTLIDPAGVLREAQGSTPLALIRFALLEIAVTARRIEGDLEGIPALLDHVPLAEVSGQPIFDGMTLILHGYAAESGGRLSDAHRLLTEGSEVVMPGDNGGWFYLANFTLAQVRAQLGDVPGARAALEQSDRYRHPGFGSRECHELVARAWVLAAEGARTEALAMVHDAAQLAIGRGYLAVRVLALEAAVRFGDTTVVGDLDDTPDTDSVRARNVHAAAHAVAEHDSEGLRACSRDYEQMGDLAAAADLAALAGLADARAGHASRAAAAVVRAQHLASLCGGLRTPALRSATGIYQLTDREREVTELSASGLSNRDIAERLTLSVRTVEGHLYRAGLKRGDGDRTIWREAAEG